MGLSSSQGRLLMLTSRMSDVELSEILISQRQNRLAWEKSKIADEYTQALSNHKLVIKTDPTSKDKEDLTYNTLTNAGYLVTNEKGDIYLLKDENGDWIVPKNLNDEYLLETDDNGKLKLDDDGKATFSVGALGQEYKFNVYDGSDILNNKEILQNSLINGRVFVADPANSQPALGMAMLPSETSIEYILDTSDDAQAESKYEAETARLEREDNQYDMQMQQLETQHEALLKEYDSIKKVISNNIDRTFNLFSDG
ncbi:hypothetical protein IJ182_03615 [bacterium]|nr:hypothetical protein [bacterium]